MSDTISDADKIRNKRLAKLQAAPRVGEGGESNSTTASKATDSSSDISYQEQTSPKISISSSGAPAVPPPSQPNPFSQLGLNKINIEKEAVTGSSPPMKGTDLSPSGGIRSKSSLGRSSTAHASPKETLEAWEDKTLSVIFRVTLTLGVTRDSHGQPLYYAPGVRGDLEEQNEPVRLNIGVLDQAILEVASSLESTLPLDFLLACWKRVLRLYRGMKSGKTEDAKNHILKEARRICMSYCIFAITMPEMFSQDSPPSNPLTTHLLLDPEDDRGVCLDFLTEVSLRATDDESVRGALVEAVEELSKQLKSMTLNDNYKPYILALKNIVRFPALVNAVTKSSLFLPPGVAPQDIEKKTLLGPFFQISPLQGVVTSSYFSSPRTRNKGYIANSQKALRMSLQTHQADLLDIVNHIIRASKESRERMLDWFALTVNANQKRRGLQVDAATVSSDGFMINVTIILDQLCDPFMDSTLSKIDRIEVDYLRRHPRIQIREETKLNADQNASDRFYSTTVEGNSNFISEIFFLTLAAHHYGTEAANAKLDQLEKDLKYLEKQTERMEAERHKFVNTPQLALFDRRMEEMRERVENGLSYKFAVQGVLFDDLSQARSMQFMRYVIVWMLRIVDPHHDFPKRKLRQVLCKAGRAKVFRCLPEYYLEDIVSNFKFIFKYLPHVITSTQSDELVVFCITFLRGSEYIKNPYLKSGLVSLLFYGIWPQYGRTKGILGDLLNSLPFATDNLLHSLMKFYIEVENTGTHTQFFDKFNIRYEIFQVIKCIWTNPIYREHLSQESEVNVEFFVRFVNLLLNDVTFVLDESLNALTKIHGLQKELENPLIDTNSRNDKEEALATQERTATSYMQLTNETVAMLKLFTDALADAFTMPEIVQRLADMLDYNVDALVGPRCSNLKVDKKEKYNFNPRTLLPEIIDVYLNLKDKTSFTEAVARDGRSYKPENFEKATALMRRHELRSPEEIAAWRALGERFKLAKTADDQAEEDLGEIPDEFLDPLMCTLMEDPVILPASKVSIDRSTIRSHLLSDPNDPFNRAPLKIEDVIPDLELKAKIQAFKAEKKGKRVVEDTMDTTSG
ncbi:hypothetical protein FGG08_002089 [Glutinoglossum americanum]|uniref:U-box domain-containing protein n=1 Tax=Glutinoglossum americanum TaxID=1670608 RepID=A0A9P8IAE0_9PEZI|nr:hypothetical protein FGG08_002089 [Glutinoglossum americanum]